MGGDLSLSVCVRGIPTERVPETSAAIRRSRLIGRLLCCASLLAGIAPADAQTPSAAACAEAKKLAQTLADRLAQLSANPSGYGNNIVAYNTALQSLKNEIYANQIYEKKVCAVPPPQGIKGSVRPAYQILMVAYAPPGFASTELAPADLSFVDYSSDSKAGTTTSTAKTFKDSNTVTAGISGGAFGNDTSLSFSVECSFEKKQDSSVELTKDTKSDIKVYGPPIDGVNHDYDEVYIGIGSTVNFTATNGAVAWSLEPTNDLQIQYIYPLWLKQWLADPTTIDANPVGYALKRLDFTATDYQNILSADPFATGSADLSSPRFTELSETFLYEPATAANQAAPLQTIMVSNEAKNISGQKNTDDSQQTITVSAKASGPGVSVSMAFQNQMTWTYSSNKSRSADGTQSVALTLGNPSSRYIGDQTLMTVYWDNRWKTWVFVPASLENAFVSGRVLDERASRCCIRRSNLRAAAST